MVDLMKLVNTLYTVKEECCESRLAAPKRGGGTQAFCHMAEVVAPPTS